MKTQKAGCILLDINNKNIGLVYRGKLNDYSFPKGHLEKNETLKECAIRETEEETGELCHIIATLNSIEYITGSNEDVEVHFYLAIDYGKSSRKIPVEDQEKLVWRAFDEVEEALSYEDLKQYWRENKNLINDFLKKISDFAEITTPQKLLDFMDRNIKYGYVGDKTNKIYLFNNPNFNNAMFSEDDWRLPSYEKLLFNEYGHCWDQVELEKSWFKHHGYEYKTIFIWFEVDYDNELPTHTYLVYKKSNKYYYFEHSDFKNKGIYEFNKYIDAIEYQKNKHIDYAKDCLDIDSSDIEKIRVYEYNGIINCTATEFINNILENSKEIK